MSQSCNDFKLFFPESPTLCTLIEFLNVVPLLELVSSNFRQLRQVKAMLKIYAALSLKRMSEYNPKEIMDFSSQLPFKYAK